MALYILTVTDPSGKRLPGCTGSTTEIAVYGDDELRQRLAEAAKRPELTISVRPAPEAL